MFTLAKVRVVGRGFITVSQEKAEKILEWKDNGNVDNSRLVELNMTETAELGDIRQVIRDDPALLKEMEVEEIKMRKTLFFVLVLLGLGELFLFLGLAYF